MKRAAACFLFLAALVCAAAPARAADRIRLALQKTGTTGWEIAVVKAFGLDKEAGLDLDVTELASTEAGKIAIQGGSADIIVSDWLWVARERALGAKLTFYPYSTAIGAVMTKNATIRSVADLAGKTLGVAGGSLDKSWLLLRAFALKSGVDLGKNVTARYGAPPLIAEKLAEGEFDAALEFWNFAADLEAQGFVRAIELSDVEKALGAKGPVVITGYVFNQDFADRNKSALKRFFAMTKKAKDLIATDEKAWAVVASRLRDKDPKTLDVYRRRYVAGIPRRTAQEEFADAATLYLTLAEIGGERLVGPAKALDPATFYTGAEGDAR